MPPAFHEQAKQLERRKTGDLLKAKIQQRPGRDELVRQHILEDASYVDPSLVERQRMLKKARLADQLNDQLSHRPGPLELIQKNILHTEEPIERAVKGSENKFLYIYFFYTLNYLLVEGQIPFKATCEGQLSKPQHPDHYITFEEDSQSSESGIPSPAQEVLQSAQKNHSAESKSVTFIKSLAETLPLSSKCSVNLEADENLEINATDSIDMIDSFNLPLSDSNILVESDSKDLHNSPSPTAVSRNLTVTKQEINLEKEPTVIKSSCLKSFTKLGSNNLSAKEITQYATESVSKDPLLISIVCNSTFLLLIYIFIIIKV